MRRIAVYCLFSCLALAGCEKPELVRYPGDPNASPGTAPNVGPTVRPIAKHLWAAARGEPPRLALCVELR